MSGSDPSEELVPKPKTTSAVWQYFGFIADEEGRPKNEQQPICKLCKKTVLSRGSNTSNLFAHLRGESPHYAPADKKGQTQHEPAARREIHPNHYRIADESTALRSDQQEMAATNGMGGFLLSKRFMCV